ncbi:Mitochondrial substrate/solute carrier [Dillenia turbinata]|uniref:Mitochondrial substrate/solute carrier n=1 Tax=Dillenia turbinata TaxID=194707 RepID=A0AAN8ZP28_9MAGN
MADASTSSSRSRSPGSENVGERHKIWRVSPSTVVYHFGTSGIAVAAATAITHPLGPGSLYLGLMPALTRSILYGGLRLGLYEPSKYISEQVFRSTNIFVKIASRAFSGAVATALTNPVEVLKVRLQMNPKMNRGAFQEMRSIAAEEGVKALWKGVGPAMTRAAALTASQLATYDESNSSTIAGTFNTLITAPVDMIKTRLMLQRESKMAGSYRNGLHCAYKVMVTEGPKALYKGGFTIFARVGPLTTITFILCEKLRKMVGLYAI